MKKRIAFLFVSLPMLCHAQSLSIAQLWEQLDQSYTNRQQQIQVEIAKTDYEIAKLDRRPTAHGEANLQRNIAIPITPVPAVAFDPDAAEGAIIPLKFATKWTSKAGISAQWNVFDPTRSATIEQRSLNVSKAQIQQEQSREEWKKGATLAYAGIVLSTLQYQNAYADSLAYEEILRVSASRYKAGRENAEDYSHTQQEMERKKIMATDTKTILKAAYLELQKYTAIAPPYSLTSDFGAIQDFVKQTKPNAYEVDILKIEGKIAELDIKNSKRQLLPSLKLNAYYGSQYYDNTLNLYDNRNWYSNSFVNLALQMPLTDFFWNSNAVKKSKLEKKRADEQLEEQLILDNIRNEQRQIKVNSAEEKIRRLETIRELAFQNKKQAYASYKAGRMLISAYTSRAIEYDKACQDVWQAQYDWLSTYLD